MDSLGNVLDHFDYTSCVAAYPSAHGKGSTLEVIDPDGSDDLSLASSWTASTITNGTIPLLLGNTSAYIELDASRLYIDIWNSDSNSGTPAESPLLAEITSITFIPAAASDSLTIDFSNGNPLATTPIYYNGSSTPGSLTIVGTTGADTLTANSSILAFNAAFGSVSVPYANASTIDFIGNGGADTLTQTGQPGNGATLSFVPTSADTINIDAGTFAFAPSASGIAPIMVGALAIASGASVTLTSSGITGGQTVLVVSNLSIAGSIGAWTGKLDLGTNNMIIRGGDLPDVADQIRSGYNAGAGYWNGTGGIISSAAAIDATFLTALGYGPGGEPFDGISTTSADVLVKYTYYGDADLSGVVDGSDYSRIDYGFLTHATGWMNGDFNYDGVVNGSDYTLIDNTFNSQGASLAAEVASSAATRTASIFAATTDKTNQSAAWKATEVVTGLDHTPHPFVPDFFRHKQQSGLTIQPRKPSKRCFRAKT